MCGIFGIVYRDGTTLPDPALLRETGRLLGHRGPDSLGVHREPGVGFVHTRLSLVDLSSRSDQPFWDEKGRSAVIYNGEIYNFRVLRSELEAEGVAFRTTSDTEVLLQGILQWGLDAILPRLEGMFAFAFWDGEQRTLVLVRDRFGIKPLSVHENERFIAFSSEVKGLAPWIALEPDPQVVSAFLSGFGGPTRARSFFRDVELMSPGTIREARAGQPSSERSFFHITEFWDREEGERVRSLGPKRVVDHFDELLFESVQSHLIADAPVGALCSGGVDSSLIMAMASKVHSNLAIFHANVVGPESEFGAASALSKHLRLDLKAVEVHDQDFATQLPAVTWHYEYPFSYHPNSIPFLAVSRLVRASGVKAILSGEGSDECYLGYRPIAYEDHRQAYKRFLDGVRRRIQSVPLIGTAIWPPDNGPSPIVHAMQQNFEVELDRARIRERIRQVGVEARPREYRSLDWLGYHLRTVLHRNDALGMAASIEARFPFLGHKVVRAAVNLPYQYKIRRSFSSFERAHPFLRDKWVVRQVADRYLPKMLSQRKKMGFPVDAYERMTIRPELFQDGFVADLYRLRRPALELALAQSSARFRVRLLMLEVWGRLFFGNIAESALVDELRANLAVVPIRG